MQVGQKPDSDLWYFDLTGTAGDEPPADFAWQGAGYETEDLAYNEGVKTAKFKRLLLNRCQKEFNAYDVSVRDEEASAGAAALSEVSEKELSTYGTVGTHLRCWSCLTASCMLARGLCSCRLSPLLAKAAYPVAVFLHWRAVQH